MEFTMEFYVIQRSSSGQNSKREHKEIVKLDDTSKTLSTQGTKICKAVQMQCLTEKKFKGNKTK